MDLDTLEWERGRQDHFLVPPDAHIEDLMSLIWDEMDFNLLMERDLGHADPATEQRDAPIGIEDPAFRQTACPGHTDNVSWSGVNVGLA